MTLHSTMVAQIMATQLVTLRVDMDVSEAVDTLLAHKVSGAPVVDADGRLVGILSEKDCIKVLFEEIYHASVGTKVRQLMSTTVTTVPASDSVLQVAERFLAGHFRRFPVVNERGDLVGQVSRRDVLRAIQGMKAGAPAPTSASALEAPTRQGPMVTEASARDLVGPETNKRFR